jgi:uncharacterized protein (DUF362 family)/tetratricopeptide (TPR) repeat protein
MTALGGRFISFLIDLPTLFVSGIALFYIGQKFKLERLSKITIGVLAVVAFISFSVLLYMDKINCPYPCLCNCDKGCLFNWFEGNYCTEGKLNGSEFMLSLQPFGSFHLDPHHFPSLLAIFLFILYPLFILAGYAFAMKLSERGRKPLPGSYSREDVKSYAKIATDLLTKNPKYSIVRYPDSQKGVNNLNEAIDRSIELIHKDGMRHFVKPGDRVLIKVNICGGNSINPASFTSLDVVKHVVDEVLDAGADQILICDADMIWTKFWPAVQAMTPRWDEWAKKKGDKVKLVNLSETELVYFDFGPNTVFEENEKPNKEIVSKELLIADVIISIPTMKMHQFTTVTLGMKNMYGTLPKVDKFYYHEKGLEDVLYWVNWAFAPTLTIIDGSIGGEAWGPLDPTALEYKTIVASNNVVWADAMAAKLMGLDPFNDIPYLRLARERMGEARSILPEIPKDVYFTPAQLVSAWELPRHSKDGSWKKADPKVQEHMFSLITRLQVIPGMVTFCNLIGDFIMWDASRLPLLKILQSAILQFLYETPQYWIDRSQQTQSTKNRKLFNQAIILIIAALSLAFFYLNGYFMPWVYNWSFEGTSAHPQFNYESLNSYIIYIIGFALAILLSRFFAMRMKTRPLITIIISSVAVGYLVESYAPLSWWWVYLHELNYSAPQLYYGFAMPPIYPLFVIPLFILSIVGLAHFISPAFAYLGLKGRRFRHVPYAAIILSMGAYLFTEGYLVRVGNSIYLFLIYAALFLLAFYYNTRNKLESNIALAVVAVSVGFIMEYFGAAAGYWTYPRALFNFPMLDISKNLSLTMIQNNFTLLNGDYYKTYIFNFTNIANLNPDLLTHGAAALWKEPIPFTTMPIFVSLSWSLNAWAACGLALLFGSSMSKAFVRDSAFDPNDPQAYIHQGDDRRKEHKYDEALKCYEKSIQMLSSQHEIDEAVEEYYHPEVLNTPLALADAWYGKGVALASLGNFKDAKDAYDQSLKQYQEAYPDLRSIKIAHAMHRKAVALQNLALQDSARIGGTQKEKKDLGFKEALCAYDDALEACRDALITNPEAIDLYADVWIDKALMLQEMGEHEKCLEVYGKAIEGAFKKYPHKLPELRDFRGFAHLYNADNSSQKNGYDKADEDFKEAKKLAGRLGDKNWQAFAAWGHGCILERKRDLIAAEQCFRTSLLDLRPKNPPFVWNDLGDVLLDQRKCDEALNAYEAALQYYFDLKGIETEQAWRGTSLMLIKLFAHAWEGKGDSHLCKAEVERELQAKKEKELGELEKKVNELEKKEQDLNEAKQRQEREGLKQEAEKLKEEVKCLRYEVECLKDEVECLRQEVEKHEQEGHRQADLSFKAYRQAIEQLDRLTLDSDSVSGKGNVLSKMMRYKEARESYEKAIKNSSIWPDDMAKILKGKAMVGKGNALFDTSNYDEALKCYQEASGIEEGKLCLAEKLEKMSKVMTPDILSKIEDKIKDTVEEFEKFAKDIKAPNKAAKAKTFAEAWQDREMYLSLMRYSD